MDLTIKENPALGYPALTNSLYDNPTIRAINASDRFGFSVVGNNLQTINSTCAALNSSPVEYVVGPQGLLPNLEYGPTNPGFAYARILDSLKQIPIYKEVLDFKKSETVCTKVDNMSPLAAQNLSQQANGLGQKRVAAELHSSTKSCSMNGSNNESSHPINYQSYNARNIIGEDRRSKIAQETPETYPESPFYNQ